MATKVSTTPRSKARNPLHGPDDDVLDARAALWALQEAQQSLPNRMVAAAVNEDASAYAALEMEKAALPTKILTANNALADAELAWREARVEAAIKARERAAETLAIARSRAGEVTTALDAERDESGNLPPGMVEAIYREFAFDPKASRKAREQWEFDDAMVDEEKRNLTKKRDEIARMRFEGSL